MYESIRGTLKEKSPHQAIVECSGLAYRLLIPLSTYTKLPFHESSVLLYLSQVIREDAHSLYAFFTKEERALFELLLSISGIGPKTAVGIVGHMERAFFEEAIRAQDIRLLSKLPGIGKKTAERLILELRDKFATQGNKEEKVLGRTGAPSPEGDAMNALIHLGYAPLDANRAVQKALKSTEKPMELGDLITSALRQL